MLDEGLRTPDIMSEGMTEVSCEAMGDAVVAASVNPAWPQRARSAEG